MQNLKSLLNKLRNAISHIWGYTKEAGRDMRPIGGRIINVLTVLAFIFGIVALVALIWVQVRPIKTADIKVPVATDQASYAPGAQISGIFFGDTYYTGEVRVLREVFCKDYQGVIKPPKESAFGDFFSTQSRPRHLEGQTIAVGSLPSDIPIGSNCVLQFTNVYTVQTIFGQRHIEYQYYTQNFSILSPERRAILDCEATGRKDCSTTVPNSPGATQPMNAPQSSPETQPTSSTSTNQRSSSSTTNNTTTNNTTNNTTTTTPAEPAPRFEEQCTVNLLGVKAFCRQVQVQ